MDNLDSCRAAVADTVAKLRAFTGTAGSDEMRRVQAALDYLGYAYWALGNDNPAWSDD